MSKRFIISTIFGTIVMLSFFIIKTLIIIGSVKTTFYTQWYEYLSVIIFMPPFYFIVEELISKNKKSRRSLKNNDSKSKIVHIYKEDNIYIDGN